MANPEERLLDIYQRAKEQGDTKTATRALQRVKQLRAEANMPTFPGSGVIEPVATLGSSIIAEPAAGLAGMAALADSPEAAAEVVKGVRESMTYQPRTAAGQRGLQKVGEVLEPIGQAIETAETYAGEKGFEAAGPVGGAAGETAIAAIPEALGIKGVRSGKRIAQATPDEVTTELLEQGDRLGVPMMTSDVMPPTTFLGKHTQQLSEKLGPLGSGSARARQQVARQNVVEGLANEFNIALDSPLMNDIVKSLNKKNTQEMTKASAMRNQAIRILDTYGDVPMTKTLAEIDNQIAKQTRLKKRANTQFIKDLEDLRDSIQEGDFSLMKDMRTDIIDDIQTLGRDTDRRTLANLQALKSSMDKDMIAFGRANDKAATKDWLKSNRAFAEELGKVKQTELKRIIQKGEATPEVVMTVLRGGKPSELNRLYNSLTPKGRDAAKAAIIRDVLDESGFFRGDVNPDRLATALGKTKRMQAVDTFFHGKQKREIDGLFKVLDATRRAQQAAATPPTGIQMLPTVGGGAIGYGMYANPVATIGTATTLSAVAKAYESKGFRNLLTKLANSKKGSKVETGILETLVPAFLAAQQAATERQQQREELEVAP